MLRKTCPKPAQNWASYFNCQKFISWSHVDKRYTRFHTFDYDFKEKRIIWWKQKSPLMMIRHTFVKFLTVQQFHEKISKKCGFRYRSVLFYDIIVRYVCNSIKTSLKVMILSKLSNLLSASSLTSSACSAVQVAKVLIMSSWSIYHLIYDYSKCTPVVFQKIFHVLLYDPIKLHIKHTMWPKQSALGNWNNAFTWPK